MRVLVLFVLPSLLLAQEAPQVVPVPDGTPWWGTLVVTIVTAVLLPFLTNYLKKAADTKLAEARAAEVSRSDRIIGTLKAYALDRAAAYAEKDIPVIAGLIVNGGIKDHAEVKKLLYGLGSRLKNDIIVYARTTLGVEAIEELGEKAIDDMIEWAANRVSPFPGKDTAKALVSGGASSLLKWGIHYADSVIPTVDDPRAVASTQPSA